MYLDFLVKIPDVPGKIVKLTKKGTTYIDYEYERTYDAEKDRPVWLSGDRDIRRGLSLNDWSLGQEKVNFRKNKQLPILSLIGLGSSGYIMLNTIMSLFYLIFWLWNSKRLLFFYFKIYLNML